MDWDKLFYMDLSQQQKGWSGEVFLQQDLVESKSAHQDFGNFL